MVGFSTLWTNRPESSARLPSVFNRVRAGVSGVSTEAACTLIFLVGRFPLSDVADSVGLGVDTEGL